MGVEQASICGSPQSTNVHQNAQPGAQGVELHCRVLIQPCTRCFWCPVVAHGRVTPLSLFVFATLCVSLFPWSSLVAGMLLQLLFICWFGCLASSSATRHRVRGVCAALSRYAFPALFALLWPYGPIQSSCCNRVSWLVVSFSPVFGLL